MMTLGVGSYCKPRHGEHVFDSFCVSSFKEKDDPLVEFETRINMSLLFFSAITRDIYPPIFIRQWG
jgi:hypothetical protein